MEAKEGIQETFSNNISSKGLGEQRGFLRHRWSLGRVNFWIDGNISANEGIEAIHCNSEFNIDNSPIGGITVNIDDNSIQAIRLGVFDLCFRVCPTNYGCYPSYQENIIQG